MLSMKEIFWSAVERWQRDQPRIAIECEESSKVYSDPDFAFTGVVVHASQPEITFRDTKSGEEILLDFTDAEIRLASLDKIDLVEQVQAFRVAWKNEAFGYSLCTFIELRESAKPN
jgi:hypothetical protein